MPYTINYSDSINKTQIVVEDNTINSETSLKFPGTYRPDYGTIIAENFLHLLENFANDDANPPSNPIEGQLWYDNTDDSKQLKLYDGTQWVSASGLKKSKTQPSITSSSAGDLWVNQDSQQLYLYAGSSWILVGPEYSSGLFTGVKVETLIGVDNLSYTVFSLKISNNTVAIYSLSSFVPKTSISGFSKIEPGMNLSSTYKIYGTSEKAENLVVGSEVVPSSNFLRSDQISTTSSQIKILSDQGIVLGSNSQTSIKVENNSTVIQNTVAGSTIDFIMKNSTPANASPRVVMQVKSSGEISVSSPEAIDSNDKLLIYGNIKTSPTTTNPTETGKIFVENTNESSDIGTGSIVTQGGVGIAKSINVGSDATVNGALNTGSILPIATGKTIGSEPNPFDQIYANKFYGSVEGNLIGSVSGRAGSADKLTNARTFTFTGDVQSTSVPFDGQSDPTITISLKNTLIADREQTLSAENLDEILINKRDPSGQEIGLFKITKQNFLKTIPLMPTGMITPYAGREAPAGWLLCDGSEIRQSDYPELFEIIQYYFKPKNELSDQGNLLFGLPDLRGRFPLGLANMGGFDSERIVKNSAVEVGNSGGNETVILDKTNLPDHEHNLTGAAGNQYYAVRAAADTPIDDNSISLSIDSGSGGTHGIPTSGNILADQALNRPLDVLNPYLAVNYIIYTGR